MNELATQAQWTEEQQQLIKRTYAKDATTDEFKLFLYRCHALELDPMKKQIYFVKYGSSPGTIVIGLDGYRVRAMRSGKLSGIERGVLRDASGTITHGWARVWRNDWTHPAYEESPLSEYDKNQGEWKTRKETMIKKTAEIAALRMAFPDELGGLDDDFRDVTSAESEALSLKQAAAHEHAMKIVQPKIDALNKSFDKPATTGLAIPPTAQQLTEYGKSVGDKITEAEETAERWSHIEMKQPVEIEKLSAFEGYKIDFGKHLNKTLPQIGIVEAKKYRDFLIAAAREKGKAVDGKAEVFVSAANEFERTSLS